MEGEIKTTIEDATRSLNDPELLELQNINSLKNCHFVGLYSLWINPTLRCFITEEELSDLNEFVPARPHDHNQRFLIHNHRYKLLSIPLEGHQGNILYTEVPNQNKPVSSDEMVYQKYKYFSAILSEDGKSRHDFLGQTILKLKSHTVNEPWIMEANEIHRVHWTGQTIALLKEYRDPNFVNRDPTDAYLVANALQWPCQEGVLYQPIDHETFTRLRDRILKSLALYK